MRPRSTFVAAVVVLAVAGSALGVSRARAGDRPKGEAKPSARADSVRSFTLKDVDGAPHALSDTRGASAVVLAWTAPGCPVAEVYAPRLAALAQRYAARGVRFFGVSSDADRDVAELRALTKKHALPYPLLVDADATLASRLSATTTTTVVVLDPNWRVRYRGAVDDQYDPKGRRAQPEHEWLKDALEAVLSAKAVAVEATEAPGCPITFPSQETAVDGNAPTWSGAAAAIVHARCATCHQPGTAAPFSLRVHADVAPRVAVLKAVLEDGRMPPWHAVGPSGVAFSNDRRLAPEEKRTLLAWLEAGAPAGDVAKAPAPPPVVAPDAWEIGAPDAVFGFASPEKVPAEGVVPYRFVEVKTDFPDDRWVSAVEVQPGAPDVVHHVLVAVEPDGLKRRGAKMALFTPTSGFFAAMVPGGKAHVYPKGMAKKLPKGATLLFQMHYTPSGVAREDTTRIGFRFLQGEPEREVKTAGAFNPAFEIPPGAGDWEVKALVPVPFHARILSYMPHMHLRGKSFKYLIMRPGKPDETILDVPAFDFNWQTPYRLATPQKVPKGSFLKCLAHFDNSDKNPYNPDPAATVRWGDQTWDEMMIGYVDYVIDPD